MEVSFAAAAGVGATGAWCLHQTGRCAPGFRPFAVVPLLFGVQQATEGFVWLGLRHDDARLVAVAARIYLFFALAFWPMWFSVAAAWVEPDPGRRRFLAIWAALSTVWFWGIYLPILLGLGPPEVRVVGHSLRYDSADAGGWWRDPIGLWVQRGFYILTCTVPLVVSSARGRLWLPTGLGLIAALVAVVLYDHAFTSVWCLGSALASAGLMVSVARAPT